MQVIFVRAQRDHIDADLEEFLLDGFLPPVLEREISAAQGAVRRVDVDLLARLGILERDNADVGQILLARIDHRDGNEVVAAGGDGEGTRITLIHEIGNKEDHRAPGHHFVQVFQRGGQIGPAVLWLEEEHFADEPQGVQAAFFRMNEKFDLVAEKEEADFVVILDRAEGEDRGDFGGQLALARVHASEIARGADIDHEHDGQFALLSEFFDKWRVHARGDVPIDRPDFVTRRVFAHLLEIHPPPLEDAMIRPGKHRVDQTPGAQFNAPDLFEDLAGVLHGGKCPVFSLQFSVGGDDLAEPVNH